MKNGEKIFRKVSNSFMLSVSFVDQVVTLLNAGVTVYIADEDAPTSLDVAIVGDALYDVATGYTLITFQTGIVWPYMIDVNSAMSATWSVSSSSVTAVVTEDDLVPSAGIY